MSGRISIKTPYNHIKQCLARSALYSAIAVLFRHSSSRKEKFNKETGEIWRAAVLLLNGARAEKLKEKLDPLIAQLEKVDTEEWQEEYQNCFGHTACSKVSLYELEYGEEYQYRQPHFLGDITAFYQAFGLQLSPKGHERADHVSIECELMHFLTYKEAHALEKDGEESASICRQAGTHFLSDHLGRWAPAFTQRLISLTSKEWMKQLADFTCEFIVQECSLLGVKAGPFDFTPRFTHSYQEGQGECEGCSL